METKHSRYAVPTILFYLSLCCSVSQAAPPTDNMVKRDVRESYGKGAETPLPESVAFYAVLDLIIALNDQRYDVARILVQQHMGTELNETTNFIDSIVQTSVDLERELKREQKARLCLPIETQGERDTLYEAMEEFDDWKEDTYARYHAEFIFQLNEPQKLKLTSWMARKSTSAKYTKARKKDAWERVGNAKLAKWIQKNCSKEKEIST